MESKTGCIPLTSDRIIIGTGFPNINVRLTKKYFEMNGIKVSYYNLKKRKPIKKF